MSPEDIQIFGGKHYEYIVGYQRKIISKTLFSKLFYIECLKTYRIFQVKIIKLPCYNVRNISIAN